MRTRTPTTVPKRRGKPNIDAASPTSMQPAQRRRGKPNIDAASPTLTGQVQHRCGKPNVDAASPTSTGQAQRRQGKPNVDVASTYILLTSYNVIDVCDTNETHHSYFLMSVAVRPVQDQLSTG